MKKIIIMLTVAMFCAVSTFAQGNRGGNRQQINPQQMVKMQTERMAQQLGLDEDQTLRLFQLNTEYAGKIQGMRNFNPNAEGNRQELSKEEREELRKQMEENQKNYNEELKKILSEEQMANYEKMQKEMRERGFGNRGGRGGERSGRGGGRGQRGANRGGFGDGNNGGWDNQNHNTDNEF